MKLKKNKIGNTGIP